MTNLLASTKWLAVLCLLVAAPAWGQESPLRLKGDIGTVEVDQVLVVKIKRPLARTVPFEVEAPDDAFRTEWIVPPGVTAVRRGKVLEVTAAPKGELTIEANWGIIKTGEEKAGKITFIVGDSGPVPPPPPPPPIDSLTTAVKAAYGIEPSAARAQEAAGFAALYRYGIDQSDKVATIGAHHNLMVAKVAELKLSGKLPNVQRAINAELAKILPNPTTQPNLPLDLVARSNINVQFARVVAALETLR